MAYPSIYPTGTTQDKFDLVQIDWDGNIVWQFNQYEYIEDPGEEPRWMARQHHDFQREDNPVGLLCSRHGN